MKLSRFTRQPDYDFARTGVTATTAILASPTTYGLVSGNATQLNTTMTAYVDALDSLDTVELAYRAAVAAKNDARLVAEQTFTKWLLVSYAAPTVTNEALTGIGLDAKTTGSTPRPLTIPLNLTAAPRETGFVNLKWKRNGNTNNTVFLVEAQIEDGAWELVASTNGSKVELSGYEPGVQVSFRVVAQKSGEQSEPSNVFVIYRNGGNMNLELAA
ncbi:MAG: fibronectin type III domain-containing protein [Armatimonadetes bacterium]|nr:fibronectin type III domain-containing protein [Armatimonadota bacterium]